MDLMLDIETLSTHPDAIILTIGAIGFDPFTNDIYEQHSFYCRVDLESQSNRSELSETVDWWAKQPAEAQAEAFADEDRLILSDALDGLSEVARKCSRIWANGISFDISILEHAYRQCNKPYPWQFWSVLDARTVMKLNPVNKLGNSHHALEDCVNQVALLQDSIKRLGVTKIG